MVYILLGTGFEEAEAIAPCDVLRRGGVETVYAGVEGLRVTGAHNIDVMADCLLKDIDLDKAEMIVVPGGGGGVECIEGSAEAMGIIKAAYDRGIEVAAICAGPRALAKLGIMEGRHGVCYPGMEDQITGAIMSQETSTVRDGKVTTGRGPGAAFDFGLAILEVLRGREAADSVAGELFYERR